MNFFVVLMIILSTLVYSNAYQNCYEIKDLNDCAKEYLCTISDGHCIKLTDKNPKIYNFDCKDGCKDMKFF